MTLLEKLSAQNKTRWLDVGCGPDLDPSFEGLDRLPKNKVRSSGAKYYRMNILNPSGAALKDLGKFDLIRMQHIFEHFSFEEGQQVLINCAKLLNKGGYIVITVPDLKIYIQKYLGDEFRLRPDFTEWANFRVGVDAPNSAFFSIFTHSGGNNPHKWCYDYEGLEFQLKRTGQFTHIQELKHTDVLASTPFTHNRPAEDACAIAQKL
jgi:predicted SAM-dependent methyltransferase